jgi:phosphocarrier protein HPr
MERTITILNEEGLHARPAGIFVKAANGFSSDIEIDYNGNKVNAKSIMSLMTLGLSKDAQAVLSADGADAEVALNHLESLVNNKFQTN